MAEDWRLILLKCKEELASDISFSMVAPSLIEHAILSADEYSVLRWIAQFRLFYFNDYMTRVILLSN